jgi:sulfide:quinone oxidoreductase
MSEDGRKRVLIAGGGVAALEAALGLQELAADRVAIELLAPHPTFSYQPMSVAEPFGLGDVLHLDLDELAGTIGAHRTPAGLTGIEAWRHVAYTTTNSEVPYDILLVACGALPLLAIPGAITFRGAMDTDKIRRILAELEAGAVRSVAFVIPWGAVWSLPAYELALLTATHLEGRKAHGVELTIVTPEAEPVQVFGEPASEAMRELLDARGISLRPNMYAGGFADGVLEFVPGPALAVDRVVALPRLEGAPIDGIPQTLSGFIPVDSYGRVHGVADVYAAGDITSFPVKQGGIATQQAGAAAEAIAAAGGVEIDPRPFQPVLRGLLLTGREPRYLRRELSGLPEHEPVAAYEPLWWPPAKIVGRRLAPFLASFAGVEAPGELPGSVPGAVAVEVALDEGVIRDLGRPRFTAGLERKEDESEVGAVMAEPVVVAPEDTLAEVAERLVAEGQTAVVVAEYGRLIGILTMSDIVRASAARVQPSEARARLWMTAEPVTVSREYPVSAAAMLMAEYGVHHLPIVDGDRVAGMLGLDDVHPVGISTAIGSDATRN